MKRVILISTSLIIACGILFFWPESPHVDEFWAGWRGPSNGNAFVSQSPGPALIPAWTLDLLDPDGDGHYDDTMGHPAGDVFRSGTQVRGDASRLYIRIARDYTPVAQSSVYVLDLKTGKTVWTTNKAMAQDISCPRSFQLYHSPRGFNALNIPAFYTAFFDTFNTKNFTSLKQFYHSHSNIGSRIIHGKWSWQNRGMIPDYKITYHHGGQLYFWQNGVYNQHSQEDLCLIDQAWDRERSVIFVLSGFTKNGFATFKKARYMLLDSRGFIAKDCEVTDIHRPLSPRAWGTDYTDVVMGIALKGDSIYALERRDKKNIQLVRRKISQNFTKIASIDLGDDTKALAYRFCMDNKALYLHTGDHIRTYTLDLSRCMIEKQVPFRTLYHGRSQTFGFKTFPANRNFAQQTIACDGIYLYHTCDDRLQVRLAKDSSLCYEHIFSDLPEKRSTVTGRSVKGVAGNIVVLPTHVLVISALDSSKIWAFKKGH